MIWNWSIAFLLSEWVIRLVMIPIVVRKRQPSSALAWLVVIFFVPWIGLVVYLLIGENPLGRRRRSHRREMQHDVDPVGVLADYDERVTRPELDEQLRGIVALSERVGGLPALGGNEVELIGETEQYIERLVADIDAAQRHVHLLYYIINTDEAGSAVEAALLRAAERGVTCRVLADAVGSRSFLQNRAERLRAAGIQVKPMLPVNFIRRRVARIDMRNHRKIAVIDGRIGYAGSHNINHADRDRYRLRDVSVRLNGATVSALQVVFLEDWHFETGEMPHEDGLYPRHSADGDAVLQVVPSGPTYPSESVRQLIVESLHLARRRVILTTPYFVPDDATLLALGLAVMRGARVDVVVPKDGDHPLVTLASRSYYEDLIDMGVRLHRMPGGLLHAKTLTIDDRFAVIGSTNFDIRSFYINFEVNLLGFRSEVTTAVRQIQETYLEQAEPLAEQAWGERPTAIRLVEDTARLFSPLL